jgi:hypothetical protein
MIAGDVMESDENAEENWCAGCGVGASGSRVSFPFPLFT